MLTVTHSQRASKRGSVDRLLIAWKVQLQLYVCVYVICLFFVTCILYVCIVSVSLEINCKGAGPGPREGTLEVLV